MKHFFSSAQVAFYLLLAFLSLPVQSLGQAPKPVVYNTPPKLVIGRLGTDDSADKNGYPVRGKATLTITAANADDTITGTLAYSIPDDARQKIAQVSGKPLNSIPANSIKRDVTAVFQSGTSCPVIHLEIRGAVLELAGVKIVFSKMVLDVIETQDQLPQLFCTWSRQINAKRQRRGIVAAINRLISPEQ